MKKYRLEGPVVRDLGDQRRGLPRADLRDQAWLDEHPQQPVECLPKRRRRSAGRACSQTGVVVVTQRQASPSSSAGPSPPAPPQGSGQGMSATPSPMRAASSSRSARASSPTRGAGSTMRPSRAGRRDRAARARGKSVILVSSGAIAEGMQRLGWTKRPRAVHELQAAAAVGQMGLVQVYERASRNTACTPRRCC